MSFVFQAACEDFLKKNVKNQAVSKIANLTEASTLEVKEFNLINMKNPGNEGKSFIPNSNQTPVFHSKDKSIEDVAKGKKSLFYSIPTRTLEKKSNDSSNELPKAIQEQNIPFDAKLEKIV